ncbi:hypothetical protein KI387_042927 [Taxus chinensis]|uniref:Uncharacterized protein n=1 Tax=Taxus chinensis TaxID=29808 RepID=A0AA38C1R4_TAXCH|nr:hypothetical protein KI387_042927 [Taxus chinensis]
MEFKNAVQLTIDINRWVDHIKEGLEEEEAEEGREFSICVFNVPKQLLAAKREAYIPQCVSIGPYHHWRSELYEMERYKVDAARRCARQRIILGGQYSKDALAWLMALDAAFVLECLQFYVKQADEVSSDSVKQLGKVLDPSGKSPSHNEIMRDLMMLENQMPLFLLGKLLEMQLGVSGEGGGEAPQADKSSLRGIVSIYFEDEG